MHVSMLFSDVAGCLFLFTDAAAITSECIKVTRYVYNCAHNTHFGAMQLNAGNSLSNNKHKVRTQAESMRHY